MDSTMKFSIPRDLRVPGDSVKTNSWLGFAGGMRIRDVIGFASLAQRLFRLSGNCFSEDLSVFILVNPHKVKAHCGIEIQRRTIV
jgi:hypothetical protein